MGAAASAQKNFDQFVGSDGKLDLQEFGLMFKSAGQGGAVSQEQIVNLGLKTLVLAAFQAGA